MSILNDLAAMLFPPTCAVCGRPLVAGERAICTLCRAAIPLTEFWRRTDNPMRADLLQRIPVEQAAAFIYYRRNSRWRNPVLAFKFHGRWRLAVELGRWFAAELKAGGHFDDIDLIVPIPLHPFKRLMRGYNQSEYLAEALSEALGAPVARHILRRTRHTRAQSRLPHRERAQNVQGAFRLASSQPLAGRHILLVDDIMTTGHTLIAAAEVLRAAGARISVATLGYAP